MFYFIIEELNIEIEIPSIVYFLFRLIYIIVLLYKIKKLIKNQ